MYIRNVGYVRRLFVEYVNGKRLEIIFNFFLSRNYVFVCAKDSIYIHSMGKERRLLNGSLIGRRSSSCSFRLYWFLWFNFVEHIPYPDTHIKDNRIESLVWESFYNKWHYLFTGQPQSCPTTPSILALKCFPSRSPDNIPHFAGLHYHLSIYIYVFTISLCYSIVLENCRKG